MNTFFKILGGVFAILFIYAAVVQYNDPDASKWYMYYGVAALASILFVFNKLKALWGILLFFFYGYLAFTTWPEQFEGVTIGEGDIVNIERGREALGLGIVAMVMLIYTLRLWLGGKSKV